MRFRTIRRRIESTQVVGITAMAANSGYTVRYRSFKCSALPRTSHARRTLSEMLLYFLELRGDLIGREKLS